MRERARLAPVTRAADHRRSGRSRRFMATLERLFPRGAGTLAVFALILASVYRSRAVGIDLNHQMSSSKALGAFLNADPSFRDAILASGSQLLYQEYPGSHSWDYWRKHVAASASWLASA